MNRPMFSPHEMVFMRPDVGELPHDWRLGRGEVSAYAFDSADTLKLDNASVEINDNGEGGMIWTVCVADPMATLTPQSALARRALHSDALPYGKYGRSQYRRYSVLPSTLVRRRFSLAHGEYRPGLSVRVAIDAEGRVDTASTEVQRVAAITEMIPHQNVEPHTIDTQEQDDFTAHFRRLSRAAFLLLASLPGHKLGRPPYKIKPSHAIAQGVSAAIDHGLTAFAEANDMPLIYRVRVAGSRPRVHHQTSKPALLQPRSYAAPFATPLRNVYAFANHMNLTAMLAGNPPPLTQDELANIIRRVEPDNPALSRHQASKE